MVGEVSEQVRGDVDLTRGFRKMIRCPAYVLHHVGGEFEECTCMPGTDSGFDMLCFGSEEDYILFRKVEKRLQAPWLAKREAKRLAEVGT